MKCLLPFISYTKHFNYIQFSVSPLCPFPGSFAQQFYVNEFRGLYYFVVLFAIVKIGNYVINRIRQIQYSHRWWVFCVCLCQRVSIYSLLRLMKWIESILYAPFFARLNCFMHFTPKSTSMANNVTVNIEMVYYFIVIMWRDLWFWLQRPPLHVEKFCTQNVAKRKLLQ